MGWLIGGVLRRSISTTLEGRQQATAMWAREHWDRIAPRQAAQDENGETLDLSIAGITEIVLDYIELTNYAVNLVVLFFTYISFIGQSVDLSVPVIWCLVAIVIIGGLVLLWAFYVPRGRLKERTEITRRIGGRLAGKKSPIATVWALRWTLFALTVPSMVLLLRSGG